MLEKDIENLVAKYPFEFVPKFELKLVGQQKPIGEYRADIVFENDKGDYFVFEVKRGLLKRAVIGQIADYYGVLKQKYPYKEIYLFIVANVIPKERRILLEEKLGIKFIEIPVSKIREIAIKYSYKFLDDTPDLLKKNQETTKNLVSEVDLGMSGVWIFQANPNRFDILNALDDPELEEGVSLVNQHKKHIKKGDIALVWMSGKDRGIYCVVDILSNPEFMYDSETAQKYWLYEEDRNKKRLRVRYRHRLKLKNEPLFEKELKKHDGLKNLAIFRQHQGTNFRVTKEEWKIISNLIKQRFNLEIPSTQ